jgi:hypothetical protein
MVKITVLDANDPKASLNPQTPKRTIAVQPKIAVVAIGSLSQTKRTIHAAKIISDKTSIPISSPPINDHQIRP